MSLTREELLERVRIPTLKESTQKILELTARPEAAAVDYSDLITSDPGLSSTVLKLVNSALFSFRKKVVSIKDACVLLGLRNLSSLCLSAALAQEMSATTAQAIRCCWNYSLASGHLARRLAGAVCPDAESEVCTAGLLHSVGIIALLGTPDLEIEGLLETSPSANWSELEREHLGFDHAELARGIGRRWRLTDEVCAILGDWDDLAGLEALPAWCVAAGSVLIQSRSPEFVHRVDLRSDQETLIARFPAEWEQVQPSLEDFISEARLQVELVRQ